MSVIERHFPGSTTEPKTPLTAFLWASLFCAVILVGVSLLAFQRAVLPLVTFGFANVMVLQGLVRHFPHSVLGACNVVTLVRLTMVAFLTGAILNPSTSPWLIFAVANLAFALDGVDGWLARRHGLTSRFGARFDMETDAALAAVLALWLLSSGTTGAEILILGFARYAFVFAGLALPKLTADLPPSFRRKAICAVQIAALLTLVYPLTPAGLAAWLSLGAALLLLWSFATDIRWLWRQPA